MFAELESFPFIKNTEEGRNVNDGDTVFSSVKVSTNTTGSLWARWYQSGGTTALQ